MTDFILLYITGESSDMLLAQPVEDGVEIFLDESPTGPKENLEMKKTDFVTLNNGTGISKYDSFQALFIKLKPGLKILVHR